MTTVYVAYRFSFREVQILGLFTDLDDAQKHLEAVAEIELEWEGDKVGAGVLKARHRNAQGRYWTYVVDSEVVDHPRDAEGTLLDD